MYFGISRKHSNKMRGLWGVILFRKFPNKSNTISGKLLDKSKKSFAAGGGCRKNASGVGCGKPAQAQHGPGRRSPVHFSEICLTWFVAESGFRIEIWTRQYRQIVQNFDPRLMEIALKAPDLTGKKKIQNLFQASF